PVVIMEPLRGGKLVNRLPEEALKIFSDYKIKHTPAQWAFRWLWNQPEVTCVLSGMNTMETVQDNIETASTVEVGELGEAEEAMLRDVAAAINANMKVGCTGCGYCMPCPRNVDIPGTFAAYNRRFAEGKLWGLVDYAICTAMRQTSTAASNCIGCGKCEAHCPQQIPIRAALKEAADTFEGPLYRTARWVVEKFKLF
ncbi:MAG: 4Fe-4S dicluster domain-containing protein, partial [Clostridia bacterium]|nr:4Fe-4S dicluster domain-containing protein [Clostridia bacterium]